MTDSTTPGYALYLRKSKGRSGIARQRTITTAHIESLGGRIVREFADTDRTAYQKVNGKRPQRDDFTAMLAAVRAEPGLRVAAWHADRLTRNTDDTEALVSLCSAGGHLVETPRGGTYDLSTATGRKRFRADALDAQYEVDHMTERITAMKAEAVAEGRWLGGRRPFGWQPADGALMLEPAEAAALAGACADVLGGKSLHAIARDWNEADMRTSTGARWRPSEVRRVLTRPMNTAPPPAQWPPLVDAETQRKVIAFLSRPDRKTSPGPERQHLLSGIAVCGECGSGLVCSGAPKNGRPRKVYRCRRHVARDKSSLEAYVAAVAIERLSRADARGLLRAETTSRLPGLELERAAIREAMRESNELRKRKLLTVEEFAADRADHLAQLAGVESRIAAAEQDDVLAPMLRDPAAVWEELDLERRRAVIAVMMTVRVMPQPLGRPKGWQPGQPYFDPESVTIEWKHG
jgi:DNA invertase Pin-like site-specific DNA recombinase